VLRNLAEEGEATEVSEARLQWAPWDEKLPRSDPRLESTEKRQRQRVSKLQSAEAFSGVVKTPGPLVSRMEPKTPWGEHAVKAA